jgi:TIR domain
MPTVWITYAWVDNQQRDVDFLAQELKGLGLDVKLDRWSLIPGKRLWDQITNFITNAAESDAWMLYATQNSLASEACREKLAYALDRALNARRADFPIVALFPSTIDSSLIPPSIRVRLFISLTDPDWKERAQAAVKRRPVSITPPMLQPFVARSLVPAPVPLQICFRVPPPRRSMGPLHFCGSPSRA